MNDRHIVVTGLMGVGKSTLGHALADEIGLPYVDSDEDIEALLGRSGRELAADSGVEALHEIEAAVLLGALARGTPHVITAAASVVENPLVVEALRRTAFVVRLHLSIEKTLERQAAGDHRRPMERVELEALADRREPMFAAVEDLDLDASMQPDELVRAVSEALK